MSQPTPSRITSIDQFRGYSVAAMFLVNFIADMAAIHPVLKHNKIWFSYADSIMPSFIFVVGFSYRLTFLRRLSQQPATSVYPTYFRRSLGLVLVSVMLFGFGSHLPNYDQLSVEAVRHVFAKLIKADLWETLAIIGVVQILIMPVVAASSRVRIATLVGCAAVHVLLSHSFNYDFVYGRPNWMDAWFALGTRQTCFCGGTFGVFSWAIPMLGGTLAYDILATHPPRKAASQMLGWGVLLMLLGYGFSCLSTAYPAPTAPDSPESTASETPRRSPVIPPTARFTLANPPFTPPPPRTEREYSYWLMDMRVTSISIMFFATGFAFALSALFVVLCDIYGFQLGVFRTLGTNALIAYIIHELTMITLGSKGHGLNLVPKDSPLWWCIAGTAIFIAITYFFVRHLEKQKIYIRL